MSTTATHRTPDSLGFRPAPRPFRGALGEAQCRTVSRPPLALCLTRVRGMRSASLYAARRGRSHMSLAPARAHQALVCLIGRTRVARLMRASDTLVWSEQISYRGPSLRCGRGCARRAQTMTRSRSVTSSRRSSKHGPQAPDRLVRRIASCCPARPGSRFGPHR